MTHYYHCAVTGCTHKPAGLSKLCRNHKGINSRHGHPLQSGVTVHELRPFVRMIQDRHKANLGSPAWALLEDRWRRLVTHCQTTVAAYEGGAASIQHEVEASRLVHNVAVAATPLTVFFHYAAMYMLADSQPDRFRSDGAFARQLARRVKNLARTHAGSYWCHKQRRVRCVYRDTKPRTADTFAGYLKTAFSTAGLQLARLEQQPNAEHVEQHRLQEAIATLGSPRSWPSTAGR